LEDPDRLGGEWLRSKGVRRWDGKVGRRNAKWLSMDKMEKNLCLLEPDRIDVVVVVVDDDDDI